MHDRLVASIPEQQGTGIVHGDYRLDNCIMAADGSVAAVLDWELCTLGDVLIDVAGLALWWGDAQAGTGRLADMPTIVEGFGTASGRAGRYAQRSERDLSALDWYVALQFWRVACIIEGVRVRHTAGPWATTSTTTTRGPQFHRLCPGPLRRSPRRNRLTAMRDPKYDVLSRAGADRPAGGQEPDVPSGRPRGSTGGVSPARRWLRRSRARR